MGIRERLAEEGYFERPGWLGPAQVAAARACVERVVERGAPGVAAYLFDPMWDLLDAILPVAREAIGGEVATLSAFWAWRIAGGDAGWPPHRDLPTMAWTDDGDLRAVTIWIALSDATTRNGCMSVLPACFDYEYQNPTAHSVISWAQQQYVRALPIGAGGLLGWSRALMHWGGACAAGEPPRVSTSFELVRADCAPLERTHPPGWRPSLDERVAIIEEQFVTYGERHQATAAERAAIAAIAAEARAEVR